MKVLDVGAHIGWFTLWCLDHGASSVVAVEVPPPIPPLAAGSASLPPASLPVLRADIRSCKAVQTAQTLSPPAPGRPDER